MTATEHLDQQRHGGVDRQQGAIRSSVFGEEKKRRGKEICRLVMQRDVLRHDQLFIQDRCIQFARQDVVAVFLLSADDTKHGLYVYAVKER